MPIEYRTSEARFFGKRDPYKASARGKPSTWEVSPDPKARTVKTDWRKCIIIGGRQGADLVK